MATPQDFLNRMQIASPCPASWAEMSGDDRARFCATCEKHVYDFSKMTAAEGVALIREKEGKVCGRLWRRADGTVITADCPAGLKRLARRRWIPASKAAVLVLASLSVNLACAPRRAVDPVPTAQAQETPKPVRSMPTTVGYSQPMPGTQTFIQESARPTTIVGIMVCVDPIGFQLDFDSPTTGMKMTHDQWEHLPLR